ncbi:hypothetical protein F5B22DRAFT_609643 [Xylaria bambusicola]|uniref:uncharacterized protein n=1 Tax=Xylaria bambusicola TaxID=326684 RepID=UPI002008DA36|nr:uncharacterized protein F5B22DRAFT_609643 [Xylaria bambusicola]KAI0514791.1 hypothetical protein F5B22DRAFT_609643 [Xylaria bambusicola]
MSSGRISSWTRFKLPAKSLGPHLFKPLAAGNNDRLHDAYYGSIAEANDEHMLVVIWESREDFAAYKDSAQYHELISNLKADTTSTEPSTHIVDFDKIAFWWRFGPNTEIRTVYFPALIPSKTRDAVTRLKGLVLTMGIGIDGSKAHFSPYNGVPTCGWAEGSQIWMNQDTVACLWCHYWKDREVEEKFKLTETRPPRDGEEDKILILEAFERDLKSCGALGWEDIHVDFKKVPKSA